MIRARYRDEYKLGYRMSCGGVCSIAMDEKRLATKENWYALALSVYEHMTCSDALRIMGIGVDLIPGQARIEQRIKAFNRGRAGYILTSVCGLLKKDAAAVLKVHQSTLCKNMSEFLIECKRRGGNDL